MFVYQNKAGHICVTFADNKPVEAPEYVIAVDAVAKKLYMVSGTIEAAPEKEEEEVVEEVKVEVPSVEVLDDVAENDDVREDATIGAGTDFSAPSVEDLETPDEVEEA